MQKNVQCIIALVVVAGVAFYGGNTYGQNQAAAARKGGQIQFAGGAGRMGGIRQGGMGGNGGGFISGSILNKDDKSITLSLPAGGSKIIFYSPATTVGRMAQGTANDLVTGEQISVTGKTNDDGSVTAQSIQIRPTTIRPVK